MDHRNDPNPIPEPTMTDLLRELQRLHRCMDRWESRQRRSTHVDSKIQHVKKLDIYSLPVATPEETIVAVKEEQGPIWDEEPIQELPLHEEELLFKIEYQHDEPTIELIGGPRFDPEYVDEEELLQGEIAPIRPPKEEIGVTKTKESWDVIPCMILPAEPPKELALILENIPVIMKWPLPPRENDRVVKSKTGPWMGRLGVQGGSAHLGPTYAETGPPRAGLRGNSGSLYGNPWDPGIGRKLHALRRVIALQIRRAIGGDLIPFIQGGLIAP